jgi:type II secretory pathway component PulJ
VYSLLSGERGLTLAEILPALALLSLGLVAMITLLPPAASGIREGEQRSRAIFLASQRLEHVRHTVGRSTPDTDPLVTPHIAFPDEPTLAAPNTAFNRSVRVVDCGQLQGCSGVNSPGLRQVSVTVGYPGTATESAAAQRGAVILTTYIGSR